jgi:hypothetical protein
MAHNGLLKLHSSRYEKARVQNLVHALNQVVDEVLAVASITTLDKVKELALVESTVGVGELERPEEVVGSLEVGSNSDNLMHEIFDALNAKFT